MGAASTALAVAAGLLEQRGARIGTQCAVGTLLILATFSTPTVWDGFSLNPYFVTPQLIVIFFNLIMLLRLLANLPAAKLGLQVAGGAVLGGALALACEYITFAANGGSYAASATKVAVLLVLTNIAVFLLTLLRFKQAPRKTVYLFATLVLALSACGVYRSGSAGASAIYPFTLWYMAYLGLAGLSATLVATFILPIPSGLLARRSLAAAFEGLGRAVRGTVELYTAPLDQYGRLEMAEGEQIQGRAIDKGMYGAVAPIHQVAAQAGNAVQAAYSHIAASRWEVDLYRRQRMLPVAPFAMLSMLGRATLSTASLLLYPVETGTLRLRLCHAYGTELAAVAGALEDCCRALGRTLWYNASVLPLLDAFQALHDSMGQLAAGVRASSASSGSGGGPLAPDSLAFHTLAAVLFTSYSRMRRVLGLLPPALGKDQPGARAVVRQRLLQLPAGAAALHQGQHQGALVAGGGGGGGGPQQAQQSRAGSWDYLRGTMVQRASQAMLEGVGRLGSSDLPAAEREALLARLAKRSIQVAHAEPCSPSMLQRATGWVQARTGFSEAHMRLGIQLCLAYSIVMCLEIITPVYNTLGQRAVWAMIIVVVLEEATTGSSLFKGTQRLVGTLAGGAVGLGIFYFVILCNGLGHANHPQKFILTTLLLAVFSCACGVAASRIPRLTYSFITAIIIGCGMALAGYTLPDVLWRFALWRLALSGIGLAINFLVVTLVLPVTSRDVLRGQVASALAGLASAAETTLNSALPQQKAQQEGGQQGAAQQEDGGGKTPLVGAQPGVGSPPELGGSWAPLPAGPAELQPTSALYPAPTLGEQFLELSLPRSAATSLASSSLLPALPAEALSPFARVEVQQLQPSVENGPGGPAQQAQQPRQQPASSGSPGSRQLSAAASNLKPVSGAASSTPAGSSPGRGQQEQRQRSSRWLWGAWGAGGGSSQPPPRHITPQLTLVLVDTDYGQHPARAADGQAQHSRGILELCGGLRHWWWHLRAPLVEIVQRDSEHRLRAALGPSFLKFLKCGHSASATISGMVPLIPSLRFEYYPCGRPHRISPENAFTTQRLLRHVLNVLNSFASTMDAHGMEHVALLGAFRPQAERASQQLAEALRALRAVVQDRLAPTQAMQVVGAFGAHVQRLFLLVQLSGAPGHSVGQAGAASSQGMAFIAMLFSLASLSRMLCLALVKTFFGAGSEEARAMEAQLGGSASWSIDDDVFATATGVMGMALTRESGSGEEEGGG